METQIYTFFLFYESEGQTRDEERLIKHLRVVFGMSTYYTFLWKIVWKIRTDWQTSDIENSAFLSILARRSEKIYEALLRSSLE